MQQKLLENFAKKNVENQKSYFVNILNNEKILINNKEQNKINQLLIKAFAYWFFLSESNKFLKIF